MTIYREARAWAYFSDERAAEFYDCEVRFGQNGAIAMSYEDEAGSCVYLGTERGEGHYVITCEEKGGRGSLHRFDESHILEGCWEEGGEHGMWRIKLGDASDSVTGIDDPSSDDWGIDDIPDELDMDEYPGRKTHAVALSEGGVVRFWLPSAVSARDLLLLTAYLANLNVDHDE